MDESRRLENGQCESNADAVDKIYIDEYGELDYNGADDEETARRPKPIIKAVALLCLIAFLGLALPNINLFWQGMPPFLKQAGSLSESELIKMSSPAVVKIDALIADSVLSTTRRNGTGFNIKEDGLILTNQHIVKQARELTVTFSDGRFFHTNKIYALPDMDLALVFLNSKDLPFLQPDYESLSLPGDVLTIIGNPSGYERIPIQGQLSDYVSLSDSMQPVMLIDASIAPGNSGSPVLNSQGKVVGVVFAQTTRDGSNNQALAIPLKGMNKHFDFAS